MGQIAFSSQFPLFQDKFVIYDLMVYDIFYGWFTVTPSSRLLVRVMSLDLLWHILLDPGLLKVHILWFDKDYPSIYYLCNHCAYMVALNGYSNAAP